MVEFSEREQEILDEEALKLAAAQIEVQKQLAPATRAFESVVGTILNLRDLNPAAHTVRYDEMLKKVVVEALPAPEATDSSPE